MNRVNVGDKVKDAISGLVGIATGRFEYLYGCVRVAVAPQSVDKDGKVVDGTVFDEDQLEVVKAGAVKPPARPAARAVTGGPRPDPARRADPAR